MGDCHLLIYHWKRRRIAHRRGSLAGNLMLLLCWMLKSDKLWMCETEGEKLQSKLSQLIKFQDNYCTVSCWLCFISATAVAQKRHSSLIFFLLRRFCKEKRACSFVCPTPLHHLSSEIGWNDFIVSSLLFGDEPSSLLILLVLLNALQFV